jgi:hypothetical protein
MHAVPLSLFEIIFTERACKREENKKDQQHLARSKSALKETMSIFSFTDGSLHGLEKSNVNLKWK